MRANLQHLLHALLRRFLAHRAPVDLKKYITNRHHGLCGCALREEVVPAAFTRDMRGEIDEAVQFVRNAQGQCESYGWHYQVPSACVPSGVRDERA